MQLIKIPLEQLADWQLTSPNPQEVMMGLAGEPMYNPCQFLIMTKLIVICMSVACDTLYIVNLNDMHVFTASLTHFLFEVNMTLFPCSSLLGFNCHKLAPQAYAAKK